MAAATARPTRSARGPRLARWWRSIQTRAPATPVDRIERAVRAARGLSLAAAILLFMVGMTIDDLHVLRVPAYLVAGGGALLLVAFGPLWLGRRQARRDPGASDAVFQRRVEDRRRFGRLQLLAVGLAFAVWLVFFSVGVPPWAN